MPRPNPLQSRGILSDLDATSAREIEAELKRVSHKARLSSGLSDYPYWRKRRAHLLRAALRYRSLTDWEDRVLENEAKYELNESMLSKHLDKILFPNPN